MRHQKHRQRLTEPHCRKLKHARLLCLCGLSSYRLVQVKAVQSLGLELPCPASLPLPCVGEGGGGEEGAIPKFVCVGQQRNYDLFPLM